MTFEQLRIAYRKALDQNDHARCSELLDQFIQTAEGLELGQALSLKAGYWMIHQKHRCVEGLSLVEEALALLREHPALQARCLLRGLGLCYTAGDVERAKRYEMLVHQLFQQHSDLQQVRNLQPWMFYHLALISYLRQELAKAYWNLVQGTQSFLGNPELRETEKDRKLLINLYLVTAEVSLEMRRTPEADDALTKLRQCIRSKDDYRNWALFRARYLQAINQPEGARALLNELGEPVADDWTPTQIVLFHLAISLIAQTQGDIRGYHYHLARAQDQALDQSLDYMLSRIQRVMREPILLEVVK